MNVNDPRQFSTEELKTGGVRRTLRLRNRVLEALDLDGLLRGHLKVANSLFPYRYTDADPFKVIYVDPRSIEYIVSDITAPARFGRVVGGDWDRRLEPITENVIYESLSNHFENGREWRDTRLFRNHREAIESGGKAKGCDSIAELESWYDEIDDLYESIKERGYKTQSTLRRIDAERTTEKCNDAATPERNEIGVNIGRDGDLIWRHRGKHRLFITRILGIDEVPVQVLTRHLQWQQYRYEVRERGRPKPDHPDLSDIDSVGP